MVQNVTMSHSLLGQLYGPERDNRPSQGTPCTVQSYQSSVPALSMINRVPIRVAGLLFQMRLSFEESLSGALTLVNATPDGSERVSALKQWPISALRRSHAARGRLVPSDPDTVATRSIRRPLDRCFLAGSG